MLWSQCCQLLTVNIWMVVTLNFAGLNSRVTQESGRVTQDVVVTAKFTPTLTPLTVKSSQSHDLEPWI